MEILVALLAVSGFLLLICVFCLIILMRDSASNKIYNQQIITTTTNVVSNQMAQMALTNRLGSAVTEFISTASTMLDHIGLVDHSGKEVFRTKDGKYEAESLDELIEKIKADGVEDKYLSGEDIDDLRKMFENDPEDEENEDK